MRTLEQLHAHARQTIAAREEPRRILLPGPNWARGMEIETVGIDEVLDYTLMCCRLDAGGEHTGEPFEVHVRGLTYHKSTSSSVIPDPELAYFWPQLEAGDEIQVFKTSKSYGEDWPAGYWMLDPVLAPGILPATITAIYNSPGDKRLMVRLEDVDHQPYGDEFQVYVRAVDADGALTAEPDFETYFPLLAVGLTVHIQWAGSSIEGWWLVGYLREGGGGGGPVKWLRIRSRGSNTLLANLVDGTGNWVEGQDVTVNVEGTTAGGVPTITPNLAICDPYWDANGGQFVRCYQVSGYNRGRSSPWWFAGLVHETCEHPT